MESEMSESIHVHGRKYAIRIVSALLKANHKFMCEPQGPKDYEDYKIIVDPSQVSKERLQLVADVAL